ncbi:Malate dehydrogenase [Geodia barretti]|uniref:Malate dehydrogenase n=1 Tax=Geodia barretti TaxID=519541 RepID=A0AA35XK15_GEOBA|nr:Malate dehydrogenase [Geodia barretti]
MRSKVTVVGAGNVGATAAQRIFDRGYADVVLVDIVDGLPQGKALDILESGPVLGSDATIVGTNGYEETADSDIVVITSGIARRPGMSRDDLLLTNMRIVSSVVGDVVEHSPNSILLPVTNPLDAMAQRAHQVSGFPKNRIVGMAGILDTARFRTFLAEELSVSVNSIEANEILPCTTLLEGEYGINDLFVGVPVKLGASGVVEVIEFELTDDEMAALKQSADSVQELVDVMAEAS